MDSTIKPRPADDPHDVLVVASDAVLMAPTEEELSRLARSLHRPADQQARSGPELAAGPTVPPVAVPPVDTTFRPAATGDAQLPGRQRTAGGRAARAFMATLLLAVCSGVAAMAWQSYGGAAEQMIARWTPQLAQPAPSAIAANQVAPQPGSPVQAAADAVAPAAVAAMPPVETAPAPGAATGDIASMRQEIDQLKASIEELKAGQQQISRDVAKASEVRASELKASEQNLRPKMPAHPSLAAARLRKPMPPLPLPPRQTAAYPALPPPAAPYAPQSAAPYAPRQVESLPPPAAELPADPELASVPRPPMPLR
jgi:hypothetical protein